jgi:thiol-disulfide isomerase/thioredoxin
MKHLLFLNFSLFISLCFNSQIKFEDSFEKAIEISKKEKKIVFVKFYGETCSHCKKLQEALDVDTIASLYSKYFVSFKINSENLTKADEDFLSKYKFNINQIPFLFFFNSEGEFIHFANPSQTVNGVYNLVFEVLNPEKRTSSLAAKYQNGNRDLITLKMYSKLAQLVDDQDLVKQLGDDIFENYPKNELLSKASLVTLAKYIKFIDNGLYKVWIENYARLDSLVLDFKLEEKQKVLKDILIDDINKNKKKWSLKQLEIARGYVDLTALSDNSFVYTWQEEVDIHSNTKNEEKIVVILEGVQKEKNFFQLNYMMNYMLSKIGKNESFEKYEIYLSEMSKRFVDTEEQAELYVSKIKFYTLSNNKEKLKQSKSEAISFYKFNDLPEGKLSDL